MLARVAATQPVTPMTATALQYQWTQMSPSREPTDAELKQRLTERLSITPVPEEDDEDGEEDGEEEQSVEEAKQTPWQSTDDLPERRVMVQRILALTEKRATLEQAISNVNSAPRDLERTIQAPTSGSVSEGATALAKRIELSLYSRAGSLEEYRNTATLRRRLQSLVSLSFHEAAANKDASNGIVVAPLLRAGSKRQRPHSALHASKRRRIPIISSSLLAATASGSILGSLPEDCLRSVFSFLDGCQVLKLRSLNRFAAHFLPSCVASLQVEVSRFYSGLVNDTQYSTLLQMTNLQRLVIFKTSDPCAVPTSQDQKLALHAWGCVELDVSHNNVGELVVQHLANAMELGAASQLKQLQLVSTFTNTTRRNGLGALCAALSRGCSPLLQDLLLGGNSITDAGVSDVARLLEARALPMLRRLDLRRNYIGECGLRRLMSSFSGSSTPVPKLKYLCMGGNLITDNCVTPLTSVLANGACPELRFLGLEDNYLSPEGVQTIIQAAEDGGMVPRLHRVSSDGDVAAP